MPIAVRCACGQQFKVADEHAGKRGKCPVCGKKLVVPAAAAPVDNVAAGGGVLGGGEETFEGVADLLDEALVTAPPAVMSPAHATIPLEAPRRKKQSTSPDRLRGMLIEHTVSIVVIGGIVAVTIGMVWGGRAMINRFNFTQAVGGSDVSAARAAVQDNLGYAVSFANDNTTNLEPSERKRLLMIAKVLPSLPEETDLSPLLDIKPEAIPYAAAYDLLRARATLDWLLEKTCSRNEDVRRFAAEVLRPRFPFGRLDEAAFAQLTERTSVAEKKDRYENLYASLHRAYEAKLVGGFHLAFDTVWQDDAAKKESQMVVTPDPRLIVACRDYVWTVDFYGTKWTGKLDDLPALALTCPASKAEEDLFQVPHSETLAAAQLKLTCPQEALVVSIDPLPTYAPASTGRAAVPQGRQRVGNPVPAGATSRTVTTYKDGVKVGEEIEWTLPERPGYSQFQIRLIRASPR